MQYFYALFFILQGYIDIYCGGCHKLHAVNLFAFAPLKVIRILLLFKEEHQGVFRELKTGQYFK